MFFKIVFYEETTTFVQNGAIPVERDIHALALAREGGEGGKPVHASGFPLAGEGGGGGVNPHASKLA